MNKKDLKKDLQIILLSTAVASVGLVGCSKSKDVGVNENNNGLSFDSEMGNEEVDIETPEDSEVIENEEVDIEISNDVEIDDSNTETEIYQEEVQEEQQDGVKVINLEKKAGDEYRDEYIGGDFEFLVWKSRVTNSRFTLDKYTGTDKDLDLRNLKFEFEGKEYKIESISYDFLEDRTLLESISLPESLKLLDGGVFADCVNLTTVDIPASVEIIRAYISNRRGRRINAFTYGEDKPKKINYSDYGPFQGCKNLKKINIAEGNKLKSIGVSAFEGCTNLDSIDIPDGVKEIENNAFAGCTSLESITIPANVTSIGYRAFEGCTSLKSITIPANVTSVGYKAFEGCTNLATVEIEEGSKLRTIQSGAFNNTGLQEIQLPVGVEYSDNAFSKDCKVVGGVPETFEIDGFKYERRNGVDEDGIVGIVSIVGYNGNSENIEIESVINISGKEYIVYEIIGAFKGCTSLKSITIPANVRKIEDSAFEGCTNLTAVNIPEGSNLYSVGKKAFKDTGLESITIPVSVWSIGYNAFEGCTNLDSIDIPDGVTGIESNAFAGCTSLKSITIPANVRKIEDSAFEGCTNLTAVNIPEGSKLSSVGEKAFKDTGLKSITLGKTMQYYKTSFPADCKITGGKVKVRKMPTKPLNNLKFFK